MRFLANVFLVVAWLVTMALPAVAEKRVALVIGNGAYQTVASLPNPPNDAEAMARMFRDAGFDNVRVEVDLGVVAMRHALRTFADTAADADLAVVFYAGHGIEIAGHNYLVPIDAKLATDLDAEDEAIDLDRVLQLLEPAKRLKLVILDACRENPFVGRIRTTSSGRSIGRGFSPPEPQASNTLVAYAARAGAVAADGQGRNSPFTAALLNNLTKPGLDVRIALGLVHDEVLKATNNAQEPFLYGALGGGILALASESATPQLSTPPPPPVADTQQADFDSAMKADTPEALNHFLANHSKGALADMARRERDRVTPLVALTPSQTGVAPTPAPQKHAADDGRGILIGLITKTSMNPYFVKMKQGAEAKAKELGVTFQAFAGRYDGDNDGQVAAIEALIAAGANGILLVPSDPDAIVPTVERARRAGLLVITLNTPLNPATAADATFSTDQFELGFVIGQWAKATLGAKAASARIATLDLASNQPTVDYLRHNGFLTGFGIPVKDPKHYATSDSPQIVGSEVTAGSAEGGRKAMENILQRVPEINVVYAINEPTALGAYSALMAAGKEKGVLVVAIDGGCPGVKSVREGALGATAQQYPQLMAAMGVEAIVDFVRTGQKPAASNDSGVHLITSRPATGVPSITPDEGAKLCWG